MDAMQHLNPLHVRHVVLTTRLSPIECAERIRADLAPWWVFWGTEQQMKGRASEERIAVSRWMGSRQRLPSEARGSFVAGGLGTRLELSIGWRRVDLIGLGLALPGVLVALLLGARDEPATTWIVPLVFLFVAIAVVTNRLVSLREDDWLVARLRTLLDASELPENA